MSDFNSYEFIQNARDLYFAHLFENEGERVTVHNDTERFSDETWAWASDLGRCPRQRSLSRLKADPTHPPTPEEKRHLYLLFQNGIAAEEFLAEACIFAYPNSQVFTQVRLNYNEHGTYRATGKADIVATEGNILHLFEVKRPAHTSEPTLHWIYQLLFYGIAAIDMSMAEHVAMHLVIQTSWDVRVWDAELEGGGWLIRDAKTGDLWESPYNNTDTLSYANVLAQIKVMVDWLQMVSAGHTGPESGIPIADPINEDKGFNCIWKGKASKPKIYKTARNALRYAEGQTMERTLPTLMENGKTENVTVSIKPGVVYRNCYWLCHSPEPGPFHVWPVNLIENDKTYESGDLHVDWSMSINDAPDDN